MKNFGLIIGILFTLGSVFLTFTFIGPLFIGVFTEWLGEKIDTLFGLMYIGRTTFYVSFLLCSFVLGLYFINYFKRKKASDLLLLLVFIVFIVFINSTLFYADYANPSTTMNSKQSFLIIYYPLYTSWVYIVFGIIHDRLLKRNK